MNVYCVMNGNIREDLDHVAFACTNKERAENFAKKYDFLNYRGEPNIEVLDIETDEVER